MTTGRFLVHVYNQWTWQRFLCDLFWRNMTTWEFRWCVYFNCNFECKPPKSQTFFSLLKEWPAMAAFLVGWPNPQDIDVEATRSHTQLHRCGDGRILHRYSRSRREWVSPGMVFFFQETIPATFRENPTKWPILLDNILPGGVTFMGRGKKRLSGYPRKRMKLTKRNLDPNFCRFEKIMIFKFAHVSRDIFELLCLEPKDSDTPTKYPPQKSWDSFLTG